MGEGWNRGMVTKLGKEGRLMVESLMNGGIEEATRGSAARAGARVGHGPEGGASIDASAGNGGGMGKEMENRAGD
jgi:hypothetical protein